MAVPSAVLLLGAGLLTLVAIALFRSNAATDAVLDRAASRRIQQRLLELGGGGELAESPQPMPLFHARYAVFDPRRQLWRDASGILIVVAAGWLAVLAVPAAEPPAGAVLEATSAPRPEAASTRPIAATMAPSATIGPGDSTEADAPADRPAPSPQAPRGDPRLDLLEPCPGTPDCYIYVVRRGDNLVSIANYFGVRYEHLLGRNPQIEDPGRLVAGDRLTLPPPAVQE